jgi:hypothetical protein
MRVLFLILLSLLLGLLVFLKLEYHKTTKTANESKQEFITQEYMIIDIDEDGYYGKGDDGKSIYFRKQQMTSTNNLQVNDIVIVYFEKDERRDGIVKVEKK